MVRYVSRRGAQEGIKTGCVRLKLSGRGGGGVLVRLRKTICGTGIAILDGVGTYRGDAMNPIESRTAEQSKAKQSKATSLRR